MSIEKDGFRSGTPAECYVRAPRRLTPIECQNIYASEGSSVQNICQLSESEFTELDSFPVYSLLSFPQSVVSFAVGSTARLMGSSPS